MHPTSFFSYLLEIFCFFILKGVLQILSSLSPDQEWVILLVANLIVFFILFFIVLLGKHRKTIEALENHQHSFLSFLRLFLILTDLQWIYMKSDVLGFTQGAFFCFLMRSIFTRKIPPYSNLLIFVLLSCFFIGISIRVSEFQTYVPLSMIAFFGLKHILTFPSKSTSSDLFSNLINGMGIGILAFEKKSKKILFRNKSFERLMGVTSLEQNFANYMNFFSKFRVFDLEKSAKSLIKMKGKPAKAQDSFDKNISAFLENELKKEKKEPGKAPEEAEKILNQSFFNRILLNIEKTADDLDSSAFRETNNNYPPKISFKESPIKSVKSKGSPKGKRINLTMTTSPTCRTKSLREISFWNRFLIFLKRIYRKAVAMIKSLANDEASKPKKMQKKFNNCENLLKLWESGSCINTLGNFFITKKSESRVQLYEFSIHSNKSNDLILLQVRDCRESGLQEILLELQEFTGIGGLVSSISHELRTPLNCSLNLLEALANNIDEITFENYLKPILLSTKNLKFIINDLIDYSSLISEKFKINNSAFQLKMALNETMEIVSGGIGKKGVEIYLEFDENIPETIKSDPNRVKQILLNLVANSIKFTQKGEIIIKAKRIASLSPKDIIEISVSDTGSGMTKESMKSLGILTFETKLVGFGLTISNYLAEYLAPAPIAGLYVESQEGSGSTFCFYVENMHSDSMQDDDFEFCYPSKKLNKINMSILGSAGGDPECDEEGSSEDDRISSLDLRENNIKVLSDQLSEDYLKDFNFKNKFSNKKRASKQDSLALDLGKLHVEVPTSATPKANRANERSSTYSIILRKPAIEEVKKTITFQIEESSSLKLMSKSSTYGSRQHSSQKSISSQQSRSNSFGKLQIIERFKKRLLRKTCNCPDLLIVDDFPYNILVLEKMIDGFTIKIESASSGDEAITKIRKFYEDSPCPKESESKCRGFKCILMDIDMPVKDGIQTSIEIIEFSKEKNLQQIIIPCTAFTDDQTITKCQEAGMLGFLSKPVSLETLEHVLYKNIFHLFE